MKSKTLALLALTATCSFAAACTVTSGNGDDDDDTSPATSSAVGSGAGGTTSQGGSTSDGGSTASSGGMGGGAATCATCLDAAGGTDLDLCGDTGNGCDPNTSCSLFTDFIDAACGTDLESGPCATECCDGGEFPADPVACGTCVDNTTDPAFDACLADM